MFIPFAVCLVFLGFLVSSRNALDSAQPLLDTEVLFKEFLLNPDSHFLSVTGEFSELDHPAGRADCGGIHVTSRVPTESCGSVSVLVFGGYRRPTSGTFALGQDLWELCLSPSTHAYGTWRHLGGSVVFTGDPYTRHQLHPTNKTKFMGGWGTANSNYPGARRYFDWMAFDGPTRQFAVLFGGEGAGISNQRVLADTWVFRWSDYSWRVGEPGLEADVIDSNIVDYTGSDRPPSRAQFQAFAVRQYGQEQDEGFYCVYGGRSWSAGLNDVWCLPVDELVEGRVPMWQKIFDAGVSGHENATENGQFGPTEYPESRADATVWTVPAQQPGSYSRTFIYSGGPYPWRDYGSELWEFSFVAHGASPNTHWNLRSGERSQTGSPIPANPSEFFQYSDSSHPGGRVHSTTVTQVIDGSIYLILIGGQTENRDHDKFFPMDAWSYSVELQKWMWLDANSWLWLSPNIADLDKPFVRCQVVRAVSVPILDEPSVLYLFGEVHGIEMVGCYVEGCYGGMPISGDPEYPVVGVQLSVKRECNDKLFFEIGSCPAQEPICMANGVCAAEPLSLGRYSQELQIDLRWRRDTYYANWVAANMTWRSLFSGDESFAVGEDQLTWPVKNGFVVGFGGTDPSSNINCLWQVDVSTGLFRQLSRRSTASPLASLTPGVFDPSAFPYGRVSSCVWIGEDADDPKSILLYGSRTRETPSGGMYGTDDVWEFGIDEGNSSTFGRWAYWSGSPEPEDGPGPTTLIHDGSSPGVRLEPTCFSNGGRLKFLFGGVATTDVTDVELWDTRNDLWEYDLDSHGWVLRGGDWDVESPGNLEGMRSWGPMGGSSMPCGRYASLGWALTRNASIHLFMYGGFRWDGSSLPPEGFPANRVFNDLWEYSVDTDQIRCLGGDPNDMGLFTSAYHEYPGIDRMHKGYFHPQHWPRTTYLAGLGVFSDSPQLLMVGGQMPIPGPRWDLVDLDDIWIYDADRLQWKWVGGSDYTLNIAGNYTPPGRLPPMHFYGKMLFSLEDSSFYGVNPTLQPDDDNPDPPPGSLWRFSFACSGQECQDRDLWCGSYLASDPGVCSNFGSCFESIGLCTCDPGHSGWDCLTTSCHELDSRHPDVCGGHGECIAFETCECDSGYGMDGDGLCTLWNCSEIRMDMFTVCSGFAVGTCVSPDVCVCESASSHGIECAEYIPGTAQLVSDSELNVEWKIYRGPNTDNFPPISEGIDCSRVLANDSIAASCMFGPPTPEESWQSNVGAKTLIIQLNDEFNQEELLTDVIHCIPWTAVDPVEDQVQVATVDVRPIGEIVDAASAQSWEDFIQYGIPSIVVTVVIAFLLFLVLGVVVCVICATARKQKASLTRFNELQDVDMLIQEQRAHQELGEDHARISINKDLFVIEFDDVELKKAIGQGGSNATVYLAEWQAQTVAIKLFNITSWTVSQTGGTRAEAVFAEFEKEVQLLASLHHPAILRFFGATVRLPRIGIVMELCSNGDIRDYLMMNQDLDFPTRLRWLREISSAMSFLHSKSIIHRDLKNENVLLDDRLGCKLMDFGMSRRIQDDSMSKTKAIGTSVYMAPEMVLGLDYSEKVDVFSFGVMVYEILAGDFFPYGKDAEFVELRVANSPHYRPAVGKMTMGGSRMRHLARHCWADAASKRPSFAEIDEFLMSDGLNDVVVFVRTEAQSDDDAADLVLSSESQDSIKALTKAVVEGLSLPTEEEDGEKSYVVSLEDPKTGNLRDLLTDQDLRLVEADALLVVREQIVPLYRTDMESSELLVTTLRREVETLRAQLVAVGQTRDGDGDETQE